MDTLPYANYEAGSEAAPPEEPRPIPPVHGAAIPLGTCAIMRMDDIELMKKDTIINCLKQFNPLPTLTGNKDDLAQRLYALSRAHSGTAANV